mgnify:CR=1 FL=1
MSSALANTDLKIGYDQLQETIHKVCNRWSRTRGGEVDELKQEAFLYFAKAYQDFDGRGDWERFVINRIKFQLLEQARTLRRKQGTVQRRFGNRVYTDAIADHRQTEANAQRFDELMDTLSPDAHLAAVLSLNPPKCIAAKIKPTETGISRRNIKRHVKDYLMNLGWTAHRVACAYAEIAKELRSN